MPRFVQKGTALAYEISRLGKTVIEEISGPPSPVRTVETFETEREALARYHERIGRCIARGFYRDRPGPDNDPGSLATNPELERRVAEGGRDEDLLVYGDWLQAQGDPRAELMAIQAAIAQTEDPARREELATAEAECIETHRDLLLGELAAYPRYLTSQLHFGWRLGFVESLIIDIERDADEILSGDRVDEVILAALELPVAPFLKHVWVRRILPDDFWSYFRSVEAIIRSSRRESIRTLTFGDPEDPDPFPLVGIFPLERGCPNLTTLRILGPRLQAGPIRLPTIEDLEITHRRMPIGQFRHLCAGAYPALKTLRLSLGATGQSDYLRAMGPLLEGDNIPRLQHLSVSDCRFVDGLLAELPRSSLLPRLQTVELAGHMTTDGVNALSANIGMFRHLKKLDIVPRRLNRTAKERLATLLAKR